MLAFFDAGKGRALAYSTMHPRPLSEGVHYPRTTRNDYPLGGPYGAFGGFLARAEFVSKA